MHTDNRSMMNQHIFLLVLCFNHSTVQSEVHFVQMTMHFIHRFMCYVDAAGRRCCCFVCVQRRVYRIGSGRTNNCTFFPLRALQQSNPVINCLAAFGSPASSQTSLPIFSSAFSDREEEVFVTLTPLSFIDFAQKSLAVSASRHLELSSFDVCSECLGVQMCAETRAWRMCGRHLFRPPKSPF